MGVGQGGGWGYTLAIASGSARFASTRPLNNKFSFAVIKSPNGVVTHRGTDYLMSTGEDGDYVAVLDGEINYCDYVSYGDVCEDPFTPFGTIVKSGQALFNDGYGKKTIVPLVKKIAESENSATLQFARNLEVWKDGERVILNSDRTQSFTVIDGLIKLELRFPEARDGKIVRIRTVS